MLKSSCELFGKAGSVVIVDNWNLEKIEYNQFPYTQKTDTNLIYLAAQTA